MWCPSCIACSGADPPVPDGLAGGLFTNKSFTANCVPASDSADVFWESNWQRSDMDEVQIHVLPDGVNVASLEVWRSCKLIVDPFEPEIALLLNVTLAFQATLSNGISVSGKVARIANEFPLLDSSVFPIEWHGSMDSSPRFLTDQNLFDGTPAIYFSDAHPPLHNPVMFRSLMKSLLP
jgi:hypothetical protein